MSKNLILLSISVLISLLAGEVILRQSGQFANYCERTETKCSDSEVNRVPDPWLWIAPRNSDYAYTTNEFTTKGKINSDGFYGVGFSESKGENTFRILFLGDSFTFGIGASEGNGFVENLAKHFRSRNGRMNIEVMNAGSPGSDPVFYMQILKRQMLKYKPDLVVMLINESDIDDLSRRGGAERFDEAGWLKERKRPWFAPLFRHSMLIRGIFIGLLGYNWEMLSPEEAFRKRENAVAELIKTGEELLKTSQAERFSHLVLFHPYPNQFLTGVSKDLLKVAGGLSQLGVQNIELTSLMTEQMPPDRYLDFYWPIDLHYNDKGYQVMANAVLKAMEKASLIPE